jgi:hypothetical protein
MQVTVFISVPARGWRFQSRLRTSDVLQDIIDVVTQRAAAMGETIVGFDSSCHWSIRDSVAVPTGCIAVGGAGDAGAVAVGDVIVLNTKGPVISQCTGLR